MPEFDLDDVVRLTSLRLCIAGVVQPEEVKDKDKEEQKLKIQLLFFGRRVERSNTEIISSSELSNLRRLLVDKVFIKFKVSEEVWSRCLSLGIHPNSECDWDAIPQVWSYFDKPNQKTKQVFGISPLPCLGLMTGILTITFLNQLLVSSCLMLLSSLVEVVVNHHLTGKVL
jgi:hypothetical protein